jgi:hypothetical protein
MFDFFEPCMKLFSVRNTYGFLIAKHTSKDGLNFEINPLRSIIRPLSVYKSSSQLLPNYLVSYEYVAYMFQIIM